MDKVAIRSGTYRTRHANGSESVVVAEHDVMLSDIAPAADRLVRSKGVSHENGKRREAA